MQLQDKVTTGPPRFVELAHHQPSLLSTEIQRRIEQLTKETMDSLEVSYGAGHTEIKIDDQGDLYFIEVGAREWGVILSDHIWFSYITGYDFLKGVIDVALNR